MRIVGHHAARLHMGIGQHLVHRQDGAGRNASGIAQRAQGIALEAGNRRRQSGHDLLAPRHPHRVARQFAVFGPARQAEQLAQRRPVLVAAGDVHELAVATAEGGRGHPSGMLGAQARREPDAFAAHTLAQIDGYGLVGGHLSGCAIVKRE